MRREVIKTLIEFDDPSVIGLLRKSLKAKDRTEVLETVGLACRYRVADVLEDLTSLLTTVFIRGSDVALYASIVGELVKTGHPSVLPHLEKIAAAWFSLSPKHLFGIKLIIYRHLHRFPKDRISKLLNIGMRSRNREIRRISARISASKE